MFKQVCFIAECAVLVWDITGCTNANKVSGKVLLGEQQALVRGVGSKEVPVFLTKNGVGKRAEVNIVAIDGKVVSEQEKIQVVVSAGQREIKALCRLHFVAIDEMVGAAVVSKETIERVSNEVVYLLNAEAGGRYQLISAQDKYGDCVISAEKYN